MGLVSEISDIIATRGMMADPDKQQIPPLRCGMTNKRRSGMTDKLWQSF
jgi:hypothetical protein